MQLSPVLRLSTGDKEGIIRAMPFQRGTLSPTVHRDSVARTERPRVDVSHGRGCGTICHESQHHRETQMRDVPCIEPSSFLGQKTLRMLARDAQNPSAAPVYWLGQVEPAREPNFFDATRNFGPLMRLVLPDERPGVSVNRGCR
ncbi:hypothetical protein [Paraburkholderia kirstenboschensis]|uniref:Uncharacterized protein n=1 Tax=Paraburkholderia kirstenboschensis TaxID=1245436 RepID=A0ABZ0ECU8_9BURK|nr:hypothetical protein [Paraburkholderia kirstenboschensis]WOD14072.1 hypothetical protein RW095_00660 [Paraburkholderia kirstenboschensis]